MLARHRARWKAHQGKVDQSHLVFIDETWIKTNLAPLRGWGPRRKRLIVHVPHGHWKTMTFLAALRREVFKTYVRNELLKTLKPGDIVVLDNFGSHKGKAVRNMIRDAGAHLMFLPPRTVKDARRIDAFAAQRRHEGQGFLVAMRNLGVKPAATPAPSPERKHVSLRPGLVDEDEALGHDPRLKPFPCGAPADDVRTLLLAGRDVFS